MRADPTRAALRLPGTSLSVHVVEDAAEACRALAREVAALAHADPALVLGFATGHTPIGFYEELVRLHQEEGLDLSRATGFNLDEYCGLGPEHPASFDAFMRARLYDHVPFATRHLPDGRVSAADGAAHAAAYEDAIRAAGGLDWQLLGVGRNGHLAFNEPGSARDSRTRRVALTPETRAANAADFPAGEEVPEHALTMGVGTILEARRLRALAFGEHKAGVVRRALLDPVDPALPVSFLREHADAQLWIDRRAAREIGDLLEHPGGDA